MSKSRNLELAYWLARPVPIGKRQPSFRLQLQRTGPLFSRSQPGQARVTRTAAETASYGVELLAREQLDIQKEEYCAVICTAA